MTEIKRKRGETFESLLRRFHKRFQQSGRLLQSRKIQFYERPKSKARARANALRKIKFRKKLEYLKKIGKLKEGEYQDRFKFKK